MYIINNYLIIKCNFAVSFSYFAFFQLDNRLIYNTLSNEISIAIQ